MPYWPSNSAIILNRRNPTEFLDEQFPPKLRALLPTALKQAYQAADQLVEESAILKVPSAKFNQGRLRAWATDLAIARLLESGKLPFDFDWASYAKPTGKYLRIRLENAVLSVSFVRHPLAPPRNVCFRSDNAKMNTQLTMFGDPKVELEITDTIGLVLVHGHKNPDFLHLGMPTSESNSWGVLSANIMNQFHEISGPELPPTEAISEEPVLTLKEELEKRHRDKDRDK